MPDLISTAATTRILLSMMLVMMVAREHFVLVQSLTLDESKKNVGTRRDWISKSSSVITVAGSILGGFRKL